MKFSKFTLQNFRSFKTRQELKLAIPNGELGSGLTYIVGENNSGKTSLLEALQKHNGDTLRSSEYSHDSTSEFTIFGDDDCIKSKLCPIREASYTLIATDTYRLDDSEYPLFIPSRRHWNARVNNKDRDPNELLRGAQRNSLRRIENSGSYYSDVEVSGLLQTIEKDQAKYNEFINLVKQVLPDFTSFAIANDDYEYVEYVTNGSIKHRADFLGDGVISILRIVGHLIQYTNIPLVIDEPELSLHPLAQKRLVKLLAEKAKKQQIIISTHEPYFVVWEYIRNGAVLNKVTKYNDNEAKIHTLKASSEYEKLINAGNNWQKPFMMDEIAKEVFFCDDILFVEGQEDVGLLRSDNAIPDNVTLFGYGVGGYSNFDISLKLAHDIGVRRAAILIDYGDGETRLRKSLESDYPNYKIIQWAKNDIRDKYIENSSGVRRQCKKGYFDEHGHKKSGTELGDYDEKIDIVKEYFAMPEIKAPTRPKQEHSESKIKQGVRNPETAEKHEKLYRWMSKSRLLLWLRHIINSLKRRR
ncbi:MAG: AAA family ATPase [Candidatus Nomurabacteria bacterium]|nr:AAA family ATPase [Candidatus Nomurabacteria bacterium]